MHRFVRKSVNGEILPKLGGFKWVFAQYALSIRIVVGRVNIGGFFPTAVIFQVSLAIASKVSQT